MCVGDGWRDGIFPKAEGELIFLEPVRKRLEKSFINLVWLDVRFFCGHTRATASTCDVQQAAEAR